MADEILHPDGRVELRDAESLRGSPLYNHDLAPVAIAKRTWNTWDYAALWISMAHCIPTYQLASGMIGHMEWWQALFTILLGNLIVIVPILLNSHPGTKYGIPFPVLARASYGTVGSNLPALMRALVACGWFGINCWIGGKAFHAFFGALIPDWNTLLGTANGYPVTQWLSFLAFWSLNILIIFRGMDVLRRVERFAAPFVLIMTAALLVWSLVRDGGPFKPLAHDNQFGSVFIASLTGTIAFWSTLSLNMPDFTRFGRSQKEQVVGQTVALPSTMTIFAGMAIVITMATGIGDPIELSTHLGNRALIAVAMITIVIATLAVNIAANVVSPANDFANAFPRFIDFKRGGLITGLIGIAMHPWILDDNENAYIFGWLDGYGGALGAVAGVLITDYWILRNKTLDLHSLYTPDGAYRYTRGWNIPAVIATVVGAFMAVIGAFWEPLKQVYPWSWFVGFGLSSALYYAMMKTRIATPTRARS
ncbi:MAG TPA: NCS1 family nucleobase:cation symporter-1 [Kofleriaceae bacterium]|nr:NCS1 family nucleobase:cation symporter-1 [Kofleriaceae bacterium]